MLGSIHFGEAIRDYDDDLILGHLASQSSPGDTFSLGDPVVFCILWGSESFEDQIALMKFAPFTHLIPLLYGRLPLTVDVFLNDSMCPFFHAAKRWRGILTRDQE